MDVAVLYVEDYSHVGLAHQRIAEALDRLGIAAVPDDRLIRTDADASAAGFRGSPIILVDDADPFPMDEAAGLSCRLYPTDTGMQGVPTVEQLVEVLTR